MAKRKPKPHKEFLPKRPTKSNPKPNAPGHGVPTDETVKLLFRDIYLATGNASKAARESGIPTQTGLDIARKLNRDPEFVKVRDELRGYAIPALERMMLHGAETLSDAIDDVPVISEQGLVSDNRASHLRAIADVHGKLTARIKTDHDIAPENKQTGPVEVTIRLAEKPIATDA